MRTRRRERGGKALRKTVEEARVRGLNGVQLAFVGDTIYDLYARTQVLEEHDACVRELHRRATALEALCGYLYLMGRNERLDELMRVIRQEEEDHA